MATIGTLLGAGIFGADKAFGRKPDVPVLRTIDPNQIQQATIAGNLQALPGAQQLATSVNTFNLDQALAQTRRALEFFAPGALGSVQGIVSDQLAGRIPDDVSSSVLRSSAGRAFGQGTAGSQFSRNLGLRDLGLTSMGIQQQGIQNFTTLAKLTPDVPQFNISSMFYSPQQRLELAFKQNESQFNRDWRQSQVDAAPDPFAAAMTQAFIQDEQAIVELIGNVAGVAGGVVGCWIARAAFGNTSPRWRLFRMWLMTEAPEWLQALYTTVGPTVGKLVKRSKTLRRFFRRLMQPFVTRIYHRYA